MLGQAGPMGVPRPSSGKLWLVFARAQATGRLWLASTQAGSQRQASASVQGRRASRQVDLTVFRLGGVLQFGFLWILSIFQANHSSRVPTCQGLSAKSGAGMQAW